MTISLYQLKPKFQQLLRPVLRTLARSRITPNQITVVTMLLSLAYGSALAWPGRHPALWLGLPLFLLLRMALNAIDGMLANSSGQKTPLGALLNEIGDQVSDAALYLPFALLPGLPAALAVLAVVLALLAEFAGVLALSVGVARRFDGPMGKSDRAFGYGLIALLAGTGASPQWLQGVLAAMMLLTVWTTLNRLRQALRLCAPATP